MKMVSRIVCIMICRAIDGIIKIKARILEYIKKRDLFQNVNNFRLPRAANENVISREAMSCHRCTSETIHENSEQSRPKLENTKVSIKNVIALNVVSKRDFKV